MIILGIDPGSVRVGYGVLEKKGNEIILKDAGLLSIPQKETSGGRLESLERDLKKILQTWKPDRAGIEKLFFTKNKKTGISVAQSRGIIMKTLSESRVDTFELSPTTIKMSVTGNGASNKKDVERMVGIILKINTKQYIDDTIDAIATGYVTAFLNKNLVF